MPLIVGTNSYVTVAEADEYFAQYYFPLNTVWSGLGPDTKERLLLISCIELERLQFAGQKAENGQALAFPRRNAGGVPFAIKAAQIELASWIADTESRNKEDARSRLQAQGVTSFSIDDLSESYDLNRAQVNAPPPLRCVNASRYLATYLNGGFLMC